MFEEKMRNSALNKLIEDFNHLPLEEKEYLIEIAKKQLIEAKREQIAKRAKEAEKNYKKGRIKSGTVKDLRKDLESD
jgi:hypothetical protein